MPVKRVVALLFVLAMPLHAGADEAVPDAAFLEFLGQFSNDDDLLAIALEESEDISGKTVDGRNLKDRIEDTAGDTYHEK